MGPALVVLGVESACSPWELTCLVPCVPWDGLQARCDPVLDRLLWKMVLLFLC